MTMHKFYLKTVNKMALLQHHEHAFKNEVQFWGLQDHKITTVEQW